MGFSPLSIVSMALSLVGGGVFLLVAQTVWSRPVSQESQRARNAFVTWWAILGGITLVGLLLQLPGVAQDLDLYVVMLVAMLALLCVGLWGLLFYLVYLFTSRRNLAVPLAIAYALYFAFLTAVILNANPIGFTDTSAGRTLQYENPIEASPLYWPVVLLLVLPPLLAAVAYLSLYWKVDHKVQKRRILLVSSSIIVWFGSSLAGSGLGVSDNATWGLVSRAISLAAAVTIYYAYRGLDPSKPGAATPAPTVGRDFTLYEPPRKGALHVRPESVPARL